VYENDRRLGSTPIQLSVENDRVRAQPRQITVRRQGYMPYSILQGPSDGNVRIVATLSNEPQPQFAQPQPQFAPPQPQPQFAQPQQAPTQPPVDDRASQPRTPRRPSTPRVTPPAAHTGSTNPPGLEITTER
jgi:serine/threonine-protein kinase